MQLKDPRYAKLLEMVAALQEVRALNVHDGDCFWACERGNYFFVRFVGVGGSLVKDSEFTLEGGVYSTKFENYMYSETYGGFRFPGRDLSLPLLLISVDRRAGLKKSGRWRFRSKHKLDFLRIFKKEETAEGLFREVGPELLDLLRRVKSHVTDRQICDRFVSEISDFGRLPFYQYLALVVLLKLNGWDAEAETYFRSFTEAYENTSSYSNHWAKLLQLGFQ